MSRPARVVIDIEAAKHNLSVVQKMAPSSKILAVIKADAYGHGLIQMARGFEDADAFGVVSTEEAIALRKSGVSHPVVLLEGFFEESELDIIGKYGLESVIHNREQIGILKKRKVERLPVWLKVNTGMNRLGFDIKELKTVYEQLKSISHPLRLMSHLANANLWGDPSVELQIKEFHDATSDYTEERTLANSGGVLGWPSCHDEWVRPGLMLYGVSPFVGIEGESLGVRPVMRVLSKLIAVRRLKLGEKGGYGSEFICPEEMTVGVAAYGYGDGYPRNIRAGSPVLVNNCRAKIISSSMDMTMLDLRGVENPNFGDDVTFWGPGLPVETVSKALDTIPYELLCGVRRRSRHRELLV